MVDVIELQAGEVATIDTTANIVVVANFCSSLEVRDADGNLLVSLGWGELFTLGYNRGTFRIENKGLTHGRVYIFRQFIL